MARTPVSVVWSATSSVCRPVRSLAPMFCASARPIYPTTNCLPECCIPAVFATASWPASVITETSSGCPPSTARCSTTPAMSATRWSIAVPSNPPHGSHPTEPQVGDRIISLGGRVSRDGIHGATFSSAGMDASTVDHVGSAVQIGDPITEKGLIEVIERARDAKLYNAITDCGAGGFSSSVGEMGEDLGVEVDLSVVPLKYPGLQPWEIWISEAQERIVIAVPPAKLEALQSLCDAWDVEVTDLGRFTGDQRLVVRHGDTGVVDMPMAFLHDGIPPGTRRRMDRLGSD